VVYALLGKSEDAIADLEAVLGELAGATGTSLVEFRNTREQWLRDLKEGKDLATAEFLDGLRTETIDRNAFPDPDLLEPEDFTRDHFSQILEDRGFHNMGLVDVEGLEAEEHVFGYESGCTVGITIVGPESDISGISMSLLGCTQDEILPSALWFLRMLVLEDPSQEYDSFESGQGYAWMLGELGDVLAGETDQAEVKEIHGIAFTAEADEQEDTGRDIVIDAFRQ
jgi:hypothetical protein